MDLTGNRRLIALSEGYAALIWISVLAVQAPATAISVLMITGGAVAGILTTYFLADAGIKKKLAAVAKAVKPAAEG